MTRLGFLLDSDSCIGCHACTIACKSEHDVPLGVNRTWVKYIETGSLPECEPTLLGDALQPVRGRTVHDDLSDECAVPRRQRHRRLPGRQLHRVQVVHERLPVRRTVHQPRDQHGAEVQLLQSPRRDGSRSVVCRRVSDRGDQGRRLRRSRTTRSASSSDAKTSRCVPPSRTRSRRSTTGAPIRRRSTRPGPRSSADGMIWADTTTNHRQLPVLDEHGHGDPGVVARTAYTTAHKTTWDRMVSGYLVTKAIAGGIMLMAALMIVLGHADEQAAVGVVPPMVAGVFLAITGALLIGDLKQPGRFFYLLTRSNFVVVAGEGRVRARRVRRGLRCLVDPRPRRRRRRTEDRWRSRRAVLGAATAGYTAFLFAQCEGRDLWQTPLLLPLLLARAVVAGAAAYAILDLFMDIPSQRGGVVDAARRRRRRRLPHLGRVDVTREPARRTRDRLDDQGRARGLVQLGTVARRLRCPPGSRSSRSRSTTPSVAPPRRRRCVRARRDVAVRNSVRPRRPIRPPLLNRSTPATRGQTPVARLRCTSRRIRSTR